MKKLFFLFNLIFTISVFAQGWNNTVTTSISESNFIDMDLCTNVNGNNLAILNWNGEFSQIYYVKYYLVNSSGSVIRSSTIETLGPNQGSIEYVNIAGDNNKVYVVYKIGNLIRAKKSIDAGVNWSTYDLSTPAGSGAFYGVDIVFDNITNKLHVVYARGDMGYSNHITHYYSVNPDNQWGEYYQVSSYGDEWTTPTVSFSQNRVHVSYHEDGTMSRDKYTTTWQNPASIISYSLIERIHAGSSKLFYFYAEPQPGLYVNMYVKQRDLSGSTWSSPTLLMDHSDFYSPFVSATNTTDGKTHIVYSGPGSTVYRNFNGSSWSSALTIGDNFEKPGISSVSNDLYVIWRGYDGYLKYRQFDANPLAPQNLSITVNSADESVLTWTPNNEPDVRTTNGKYKIYRAETDLNGNLGPYQLVATINAMSGSSAVSSWIDTEAGKSKVRKLYYKISALDIGLHESTYSNEVWRWGRILKISTGENPASAYNLQQNYPNPFNPATMISYSIKEEGLVTLKIYDVLGKEIATLVNENKPEGNYEVEFDASQLPSGMYIYKMQSGSFSNVKKMLLTK